MQPPCHRREIIDRARLVEPGPQIVECCIEILDIRSGSPPPNMSSQKNAARAVWSTARRMYR
jgi:hypothetical protein